MKHRYAYETDITGGSAAARLVRLVGKDKDVLELGTGPGSVTQLLQGQGCRVTGVELDPQSAEICRRYCVELIQSDLESGIWLEQLRGKKFDVVVIADVLEHLREPEVLLNRLSQLLRDDGYLALSVPNVSHLTVVASLLAGRFPYQQNGLLDQTHLRFFGREDIEALLRQTGFMWHRWEAARLEPMYAELKGYWNRLNNDDKNFLANRVVDGDVYQHVITAFPSTEAGHVTKAYHEVHELRFSMDVLRQKMEAAEMAHAMECDRFAGEVNQRDLEIDSLRSQLDNATSSCREIQTYASDLKAERSRLMAGLNEQAGELTALMGVCQELREENAKIENLVSAMKDMAAVDVLRLNEIQRLKLEREQVKASMSWRISSPVRFFGQMLSKRD